MVSYGCYHIVGDSLAHNYQETIFMTRTTSSMVKIMKQELEVDDILLQCFEVLTSSIFIELFDSSSGEDLTTFPLSMKFLKYILQSDASLSSKPSTPMGSIQFVVSCLHAMVLPRQTSNKLQTLDYDKIPL